MTTSAIEWTEATWNPTTGCDRTSPGCDNCLAPDTPVLMADMSWRPIAKVVAGDEVVAFTEAPALGQSRVYERATVVHVWETRAEAVEITAGDRVVVASVDHRFLAHVRPYWRAAERLTLSSGLVDAGMPSWLPDVDSEPYLAGYLAGAIAGHGTLRIDGSGKSGTKQSYLRVAVLATDKPILDRMAKAFAALGCTDIGIRAFDGGPGGFVPVGERAPMSKIETRRMANLTIVRDVCLPERDDPNWKAGFLAGFFDTDGCYSGGNLRFTQTKDNGHLDATHRFIDDLGFGSTREDFRSTAGRSERVIGNVEEKLRFLPTIEPALVRKVGDFYGRRFPGKHAAEVDGIRRVGVRDLIDIETTSGTFIAAGFAAHNCYAMTLAKRLKAMGQAKYQKDGDPRTSGPGFGLTLHEDALDIPGRWRDPRVIFVNSMSDLFHPEVPLDFIRRVFDVMADTPRHTYQVLTKRSKRLVELADVLDWVPNLWIGVSIESDRYCFRADHLRAVPARGVRFLSLEPLIGAVPSLNLDGIDWAIVGGESGARARPMELEWVAGIQVAAAAAKTAVFVKQLGSVWAHSAGRRGKGNHIEDWPESLRIRQMPTGPVSLVG